MSNETYWLFHDLGESISSLDKKNVSSDSFYAIALVYLYNAYLSGLDIHAKEQMKGRKIV